MSCKSGWQVLKFVIFLNVWSRVTHRNKKHVTCFCDLKIDFLRLTELHFNEKNEISGEMRLQARKQKPLKSSQCLQAFRVLGQWHLVKPSASQNLHLMFLNIWLFFVCLSLLIAGSCNGPQKYHNVFWLNKLFWLFQMEFKIICSNFNLSRPMHVSVCWVVQRILLFWLQNKAH